LAGVVEYWNESLAIDENKAMDERRDELWDLELEAFMGHIDGALDAQVMGMDLAKLARTGGGTWMPVR